MIGAVLANSSLYMHEVYQEMRDVFELSVSPPTICCLLHSYGITRKKIREVALQRSYSLLLKSSVHSLTLIPLFLSMRQDLTIGPTSEHNIMGMH